MKNPLNKKLRGFQRAPRERFKLLKDNILTTEELLLYEFLIAITDWDKDHENYGLFKATDEEIAEILGWKSRSTICKYRGSLINKGLLIPIEGGRMKAKDYSEWDSRKPSSLVGSKEKVDINDIAVEIEQLDIKELKDAHESRVAEAEQNFVGEIEQEFSKIEQEGEEFVQNRGLRDEFSLGSSKGEFNKEESEKQTDKNDWSDFIKWLEEDNL